MKAPTCGTIQGCIEAFIEATNTNAVASAACICCAREDFVMLMMTLKTAAIPNQHLLKPNTPHIKQDLLNGMVIYKPALTGEMTTICHECL